jgi:hypothetical protein
LATNDLAEKIKIGIDDLKEESLEIAKVIGAIIVSAKKDK